MAAAHARLPHEPRRRLSIAALVAGLGLVIFGGIVPSWQFAGRAKADWLDQRALQRRMQQMAPALRTAAAQREPPAADGDSLLTMASKTSQAYRLTFQRYDPSADGKLSLWLSDAEFNQLLTWLDTIAAREQVQIDRVAISQTARPGLVDAQIVLRR